MNREEFKKLLLENKRHWDSQSLAQRVTTPILVLGMWIRHGNSIGCFLTNTQYRKANFLCERLTEEYARIRSEFHQPQSLSLAFTEARRLTEELECHYFPENKVIRLHQNCKVIPFRKETHDD